MDWDGSSTLYQSIVDYAVMSLNLTTPILFDKIKHKEMVGLYKFKV
jgi:hypothetical protein